MESSAETSASSPPSLFGSPLEPIYTENEHLLTPDLLQDSLTLLSLKNDLVLSLVQENTSERKIQDCIVLKSGYPAQFIFELCKHFKLSSEVQYKAAQLFHQFMVNHIIELYQVSLLCRIATL